MGIKKLLIANRGEIVLRIIRTSRKLGIKTVAVYSDADEGALHTVEADEAFPIGPSLPTKSYLNIESILNALKKSGADAVHPGYGFLAENARFAEAVLSEGGAWVGPSPEVMRRIESKCFCRRVAESVHVPCIPGTQNVISNVAEVKKYISENGGPVLLKADRGGGGKGIEVIENIQQAEEVYEKVKRLGEFAFGSPDCYIEQKLVRPRHIEVQFLADSHGNVITLGERECSIQRRCQKIIEEAPAPGLTEKERGTISGWTINLVKALGYQNAGTIEFLRSQDGNFYFMEINARLQVEHAVTEFVTGIDIVDRQLAIASGENLNAKQEDVMINGHSIEARVYAENPITFLPSPGIVEQLQLPEENAFLRIDHALNKQIKITPYYDPLLAKVIVWGQSRNEAIDNMKAAFSVFSIKGVETTIPTNQEILDSSAFQDGKLDIHFMEDLRAEQASSSLE